MSEGAEFTDSQISEFLRRSYFVVDGLWFVKVEDQHGFDEAMKLDESVWAVMSKIQARKARQLLGIECNGLPALAKAFQLKLTAEGFEFATKTDNGKAAVTVRKCPWFEILRTSDRTQIAEVIADRICAREYAGWAKEFGPGIEVSFKRRLCVDGCDTCSIVFSTSADGGGSSA